VGTEEKDWGPKTEETGTNDMGNGNLARIGTLLYKKPDRKTLIRKSRRKIVEANRLDGER